jgi:hypothetical protein
LQQIWALDEAKPFLTSEPEHSDSEKTSDDFRSAHMYYRDIPLY